ncbi:hypothetical protein PR048_009508 [Dryococelus australis]|uniref:Uncharacterized protein n=1 Tax=Dryococelus australis TaxID=614101 RepID=A0ABQ9I1X6_9NEOP|nr:hypothetical protein PR048_009508 [Dryococelus australis]
MYVVHAHSMVELAKARSAVVPCLSEYRLASDARVIGLPIRGKVSENRLPAETPPYTLITGLKSQFSHPIVHGFAKSIQTNSGMVPSYRPVPIHSLVLLLRVTCSVCNDLAVDDTLNPSPLLEEARAHGVGYYGFSSDEGQRRSQQEALSRLRQETAAKQQLAQEARQRRQQQLAARLKAARNRQRARLGLPPEEDEQVLVTWVVGNTLYKMAAECKGLVSLGQLHPLKVLLRIAQVYCKMSFIYLYAIRLHWKQAKGLACLLLKYMYHISAEYRPSLSMSMKARVVNRYYGIFSPLEVSGVQRMGETLPFIFMYHLLANAMTKQGNTADGGGGARRVWSSVRMQGREKREIPGKTCRPAASSGMIPVCENPESNPVRLCGSEYFNHYTTVALIAPETPAQEKEEEEQEPSAPETVQSEEIPQQTADIHEKVPQVPHVRPWDIGKLDVTTGHQEDVDGFVLKVTEMAVPTMQLRHTYTRSHVACVNNDSSDNGIVHPRQEYQCEEITMYVKGLFSPARQSGIGYSVGPDHRAIAQPFLTNPQESWKRVDATTLRYRPGETAGLCVRRPENTLIGIHGKMSTLKALLKIYLYSPFSDEYDGLSTCVGVLQIAQLNQHEALVVVNNIVRAGTPSLTGRDLCSPPIDWPRRGKAWP